MCALSKQTISTALVYGYINDCLLCASYSTGIILFSPTLQDSKAGAVIVLTTQKKKLRFGEVRPLAGSYIWEDAELGFEPNSF